MEDNTIHSETSNFDFDKIWKIIWYRKWWSLSCYIIIIIAAIIITLLLPKKYTSEASILINKASTTNLADINPYILGQVDLTDTSSVMAMFGNSSAISTELDIIKSQLVMKNVIKDNNITYKNGHKKGELLTVEDFLEEENIAISSDNDSSIINISYKSESPKTSYDVVMSVIKYYKNALQNINSQKAISDKDFLHNALKETENELQTLSDEYATFKKENKFIDTEFDLKILATQNPFNKRIAKKLSNYPEIEQKGKELELKFESILEKYNLVKKKYEWASLVELMSKDTSNITILNYPREKKEFEKSEPSLKVSIIAAIVISIIFSSIFVICLEMYDKQLTFFAIKTCNTFWISKNVNNEYINEMLLSIGNILNSNNYKKISLIALNFKESDCNFIQSIFEPLFKETKLSITNYTGENVEPLDLFKIIDNNDAIILSGKVGLTNKATFIKVEEIINKKDKLVSKLVLMPE